MTMKLTDFQGCLIGLAIGDALGAPCEFGGMPDPLITGLLPWRGQPAGTWTDDTEMTLAVAMGLIKANSFTTIDDTMQPIAAEFAKWYHKHDGFRGPGNTCLGGCRNLANRYDWRISGVKGDGCGAIMRVAPVGLVFENDITKLVATAAAQAKATHDDAGAIDAAVAGAVIIAEAKHGILEAAKIAHSLVTNEDVKSIISLAIKFWETNAPIAAVLDAWHGWDGVTALGASLVVALRHQDDFKAGVLEAINSPGDSDSLGCIVGAILGARLGLGVIPYEWVETVEAKEALLALAAKLYSKTQTLNNQ